MRASPQIRTFVQRQRKMRRSEVLIEATREALRAETKFEPDVYSTPGRKAQLADFYISPASPPHEELISRRALFAANLSALRYPLCRRAKRPPPHHWPGIDKADARMSYGCPLFILVLDGARISPLTRLFFPDRHCGNQV
jgi:hypothetical protein